ncbi:MAG: hypothetical protein ACFFBP_10905 [Promethearchaeota archaeon]
MQERRPTQKNTAKEDIIGSETIFETLKRKTPWFLGNNIRKPKIKFPRIKRRRLVNRLVGMSTRSIVLLAIFIILFALQTGMVYLIYREVPAIGQGGGDTALFLYPSPQEAFINESIVASILMIFNSVGYLFLYQASKHLYNRKIAIRYILIGILIILGSFVALQAMIRLKMGEELFGI